VARQLQYPHDSHDAEDLDNATHVLERLGAVASAVETERKVERHDRQHVDEVQRTLKPPAHRQASDTLNVLLQEDITV